MVLFCNDFISYGDDGFFVIKEFQFLKKKNNNSFVKNLFYSLKIILTFFRMKYF